MVSVILISTMSNTVFKGIYFGTLAKTARKETLIRYMIWALLHIPLILKAYEKPFLGLSHLTDHGRHEKEKRRWETGSRTSGSNPLA